MGEAKQKSLFFIAVIAISFFNTASIYAKKSPSPREKSNKRKGHFTMLTPSSTNKKNISAYDLQKDSFLLARKIFESGFRPTFLIALWRGGAPIGIAIDEYFRYKKSPIKEHCAIKVSAYNHDQLKGEVDVSSLEPVAKIIKPSDKLLIVDDIVDTGSSIENFLSELHKICKQVMPQEIRVAAPYYKSKISKIEPHYFLYDTEKWIVFPHELEGLNESELKELKGSEIFDIITK